MKHFTPEAVRASMLLYAVTDRTWLGERSLEQATREILENGATFLQLREKDLDHGAFLAEAHSLKKLAAEYGVPFVVNDDIEICLACGADGVHVGQSDLIGKDVRGRIGPDRILGISAGTVEEAVSAQKAGADYIGVGAVFDTSTKRDAHTISNEALRAICSAVEIPVVAIGGITAGNLLELAGSGVDGVAVVSALYAQKDPGAAARALLALARKMVKSHG